MEFKYVKNIQFSRLIKCDGKLKEFNFRKPNGKLEGPFTVDVIDAHGNRIIFNMEMNAGSWKIISPEVPVWVMEGEPAFHDIIDAEFKSI